MCGIVGMAGFQGSTDHAEGIVRGMAERIRHRGPDGGGVAAHPDATVGMTRLAIVDVEHGHQPMANEDGSIMLVYNGEIYNAPALRERLEKEGVRFRTRSDTEVILRLYEKNPERVEEELVGMWALAIHDRRRKRLVLSRDRFGIKPLFYVLGGTAIAWASELRCFDRGLAPFTERFQIDTDAAQAMVTCSFTPYESTIYRGVARLAPATRLTFDIETASVTQRTYFHLTPMPEAGRVRTLGEAAEETERLLRRAVKEHLESDVPIATFLSGGIDSSLVSAYALEQSSRPIAAYTIGFHEKEFDESPYARAVARALGISIDVGMFDEKQAIGSIPDVLCAYDEPFGDSSSLPTCLVSSRVGKSYKVALGGDGGDEVFAGYYGRYRVVRLREPFRHTPRLRDALGKRLAGFHANARLPGPVRSAVHFGRRLARGLQGSDAAVYAALNLHLPFAETSRLMCNPTDGASYDTRAMRSYSSAKGTPLQRFLASDLENGLANDMLVKVDRASMSHHLEARVPFLDHRLVEWGVGLPSQFTLGTKGKRVLRHLFRQKFGDELADRPKRGFGIPVKRWLDTAFDRPCELLFDAKRLDRYGILSSAELSGGRFREWRQRAPYVLWHAMALAAWCEIFLGDGEGELRSIFAETKV